MRRFQFRLQTVLEVRKRREEQARMRLGEMEQALECLNREKENLTHDVFRQQQRLRFEPNVLLSREELMQDRARLDLLQRQLQAKGRQVEEFSLQVEEQRKQLLQCCQDREVAETIRQKHFEEWRKTNEREEQGVLDEIGSVAFIRHRRQSGGVSTYLLLFLMILLMGLLIYVSGTEAGREWIEDLSKKLVFRITSLEPRPEVIGEVNGEVVSATEEVRLDADTPPPPVSIESVERERARLARRERELEQAERRNRLELMALAELKEEIAAMQAEIDEKMARMEQFRQEQEERMDEEKERRLDNLAKLYSDSRPKVAAELLLEDDPETIVDLFNRINQRNLVRIVQEMNKIDTVRTQQLLNLYAEQSMNPISF